MTPRAAVVLLAAFAASCGVPLMKLPQGPIVPMSAEDAARAYAVATTPCADLETLTAEVAVSGSAGGRRMRGRLLVGVKAPASARIEAVAPFGQPFFIFTANGDDASLLLPRDHRILRHDNPGEVLDAVAGIPLSAADLRTVLTGCADEPGPVESNAIGRDWLKLTKPQGSVTRELYLHRASGAEKWRTVAELRSTSSGPLWRAEYHEFQNDLPRSIHLISGDGRTTGARRFDVTLALSQVETNVPLGADVFTIQIPKDAEPISLEELRQSGPMASQSDGQ